MEGCSRHEAVLALARLHGRAIGERDASLAEPTRRYDEAGGDRLHEAFEFLAAVRRGDARYMESSRQALEDYRSRLEEA